MIPYFAGGSIINGTPDGDRWAQGLGGQIRWLSDPLRRVDADCSGCTNLETQTCGKREKKRPTEHAPRKPQQSGDRDHLDTACDYTRPTRSPTLTRFHRSRGCGNWPRTALGIRKNDKCETHTDRQTNVIMAPCTHPGMKRLLCPNGIKRPRLLRFFGLASK